MTPSEQGKTVLVPRSERGRAARARLLRAAEASFGEQGFAAASVSDIVRRAGVSQGSFYVYFPSKESIFRDLILDMSYEIRQVTRQATEGVGSRSEAELAGALAFFDWLQDHTHLHRILHQIDQFDEVLAQEFYRSIAEGYDRGLTKSIDAGEIAPVDPELLAYALMGISHFVSMRYVLWGKNGFPDSLRADLGQLVRNVLGVSASPIQESRGGAES